MPNLPSEQQPRCKNPNCQHSVMHTYTDANGNDLGLCDEHYYDAVMNNTSINYVQNQCECKEWNNPFGFLTR